MKKLMIGLVAAALLPLSVSVQAKTVCLSAFGGADHIKLVGVTPLKKPGSVALIKGIWREGGFALPIEGSAATQADGSVFIGFTMHTIGVWGYDVYFGGVAPDSTLVGATLQYGFMGESAPSSSTVLGALSCKDF